MRKALIYGAGEAGSMVLSEILRHPEEYIFVAGFIDDDIRKKGKKIYGVEVLGDKKILKQKIDELSITEVIIAMPSISKNVIRDVVRICKSRRVKLLIVPSTMEIIEGVVRFDQIKSLDLADLLDRDEMKVDSSPINSFINGKKVLVTGAAGSIGSELVRKIIEFSPSEVIALDINENGLFYLMQDFGKRAGSSEIKIIPLVVDIKNIHLLKEVFSKYYPQIVFHTAAYKHVPLMEYHARVAFLNNVIGTYNLLNLSSDSDVIKFIGISTDKAVKPLSIMGKTKRICELLTLAYAQRGLKACSVRFGNVLGSNGSVVTVFHEQIKKGGPVTITSPDMERYFMTVNEAVSLVLQAGSSGDGGFIYVLDMGKPIRIINLATNVIILSGLTPGEDIKIHYTGVREGEKHSEELFYNFARVYPSKFKGIFVEENDGMDDTVIERVEAIAENLYSYPQETIVKIMDSIIDHYSPDRIKKEIYL